MRNKNIKSYIHCIDNKYICYDFYKDPKYNKISFKKTQNLVQNLSFSIAMFSFKNIRYLSKLSLQKSFFIISLIVLALIFFSYDSFASILEINTKQNNNIYKEIAFFNNCIDLFIDKCKDLSLRLNDYAYKIFYSLLFLTILINGFLLILKRSLLENFIFVIVKICLINGFYLYFLQNCFYIAGSIVDSFTMMVGHTQVGPTELLAKTLNLLSNLISYNNLELLNLSYTFLAILVNLVFLFIMVFITAKFTAVYLASYLLASVGCIFISLSSLDSLKDLTSNYFKAILALGIELFITLIVANIGCDFIDNILSSVRTSDINLAISFILIFMVLLISLIIKISVNSTNNIVYGMNISLDKFKI